MQRNRNYAAAHGYAYYHVDKIDLDLPIFWVKPFLVAHYLDRGYDTVLWLDTDAVIHDLGRRVEALFVGDEGFVYAPDNPIWNSPFNAGVFACKRHALPMLREWCSLYPRDDWFRNARGEWKCRHEQWAGPAYEQGAFVPTILPKYQDGGLLKSLPWETLQSPLPTGQSFSLHFPAYFKWNIPVYLAALQAR